MKTYRENLEKNFTYSNGLNTDAVVPLFLHYTIHIQHKLKEMKTISV